MRQVRGAVNPSSSQASEAAEPSGASSSQASATTEPNPVKRRTPEEYEVNRQEALRRRREQPVSVVSSRELRPLQMKAVAALERTDWQNAIIVMPTGSGKTTLIWSFKKEAECSIVIAPYRLLADQLEVVLGEFGKVFRWPLTEEQGSGESLLSTAKFVVISFETAPDCVGLITQLEQRRRLGPIWVDEVMEICQLIRCHVICHPTQVHTLKTEGSFRVSLDSFWTLAANLSLKGVDCRFIGLTATLRTDDVLDIMKRLGSENMLVSRASCYRAGLTFEFRVVPVVETAMDEAVKLVKGSSEPGKILVFTTGVEMCVQLGSKLQKDYPGWVR